jgi:hypothetical protein
MLLSLTFSQKQGRNEDGILNEFDHIAVASVHAFLQVSKLLLLLLLLLFMVRGCMCCDWPLPRGLPLISCRACCPHANTAALPTPASHCRATPTSFNCHTFSLPHVLFVIAATL